MNCPNCGREARGSFCTGCGTRLVQSGDPSPAPPADPDATSVIDQQKLREFQDQASHEPPAGPSTDPAASEPPHWQPAAPADWQETAGSAPSSSASVQASYDVPPPVYSSPATQLGTLPPAGLATAGPFVATGGYPIRVAFDVAPENKKLFAIPVIGWIARVILLIPNIIVLYLVAIVAMVIALVAWIPVLTTGRYPAWGYKFVGGALRWGTNVAAYFYGLTDQYPPFSLADQGDAYPVHVTIEEAPSSRKLYAIPVVGYIIRLVLLIPHLVVIYVLGAIAGLVSLIAWIPVLTGGRYPDWGYSMVGGYIRWIIRVNAYFLGLTDVYPPFQLGYQ
jgi:Domain of unknown function (DUF4389)